MLLVSLALFLSEPVANLVEETAEVAYFELYGSIEYWTESNLLVSRKDLPSGLAYDTTVELTRAEQMPALRVLAEVVRQYPQGVFATINLRRMGLFGPCGDARGDGFRPWVEKLNGYRYFGRRTSDGILVCRYSDSQMIHTFHHEVFHQVEAQVLEGNTRRRIEEDDQRFERAISSLEPYPPLRFDDNAMALLREASTGVILEDAVSVYAQKSPSEDKAETAFWFQTHLADALLQAALRPELPGSQRILHILQLYQRASVELTLDWWLSVIRDQVLANAEGRTRF
jgi:hypothetical protein